MQAGANKTSHIRPTVPLQKRWENKQTCQSVFSIIMVADQKQKNFKWNAGGFSDQGLYRLYTRRRTMIYKVQNPVEQVLARKKVQWKYKKWKESLLQDLKQLNPQKP